MKGFPFGPLEGLWNQHFLKWEFLLLSVAQLGPRRQGASISGVVWQTDWAVTALPKWEKNQWRVHLFQIMIMDAVASWQVDGLGGTGKHSILWSFYLAGINMNNHSEKPRGCHILCFLPRLLVSSRTLWTEPKQTLLKWITESLGLGATSGGHLVQAPASTFFLFPEFLKFPTHHRL